MFRSHLMQQFASVARTQSRPPLALTSISTSRPSGDASSSDARLIGAPQRAARKATQTLPRQRRQVAVSISSSASQNSTARSSSLGRRSLSGPAESSSADVWTTTSTAPPERSDPESPTHSVDEKSHSSTLLPSPSALHFQSLLQSRTTASRWNHDLNSSVSPRLLSESLDRAILCARHAPNHKRTEPFRFVRMLRRANRNSSIEALADICYHVTLHQRSKLSPKDHAEVQAASKRDKWAKIPAYLVVLVDTTSTTSATESDTTPGHGSIGEYEELPFEPPRTERQLEDYASASAAVQNVLLSLHSEGLGTKWATGPVIHTPAFRTLCGVQQTERVVGLIMVGIPVDTAAFKNKPRRYRRSWDDLVHDV